MSRSMQALALVGLFLAGLWVVTGGTRPASGAGGVPATEHFPEDDGGRPDRFWWKYLGEGSTASVWFGPWMEGAGTPKRQWVLVCTLPGTYHPLSLLQGTAKWDDDARIMLQGHEFMIELRPKPGLLWGDVESEEQLDADLFGFF